MATTWKIVRSDINKSEILSLSIQAVVDGVDGKTYSAKINKNRPDWEGSLFALLKDQINADRAIESEKTTIEAGIDLTNFETFVNT